MLFYRSQTELRRQEIYERFFGVYLMADNKIKVQNKKPPAENSRSRLFIQKNRVAIRFGLIFFLLINLFYIATFEKFAFLKIGIGTPFTIPAVKMSELLLNLLRIEASSRGVLLTLAADGRTMNVANGCNGLVASLIFLAAISAYPASLKKKLKGIIIGLPLIYFFNIFRIVGLFITSIYLPGFFDQFHLYIAQSLFIAITIAIWLFWIEKIVEIK